MSDDSQVPKTIAEHADGTAGDATTAAAEALPIGGLLWIPAVYLGFATLVFFGRSVKSLESLREREVLAGAASVPGLPHSPGSLRLLVEASGHFAFFFVFLWIVARFFQRRRNVPMLIIVVSLLLNLVAPGVLYVLGPGRGMTTVQVVGAVIGAALFVSYFSLSKRVKRTFLL